MDMNELFKWIPDYEKDRLRALEETFSTKGWKAITEWAELKATDELLRAANATAWDANRIAHGRHLVYVEISNFAETIITEYAAMAEEAKADAEVLKAEDFE